MGFTYEQDSRLSQLRGNCTARMLTAQNPHRSKSTSLWHRAPSTTITTKIDISHHHSNNLLWLNKNSISKIKDLANLGNKASNLLCFKSSKVKSTQDLYNKKMCMLKLILLLIITRSYLLKYVQAEKTEVNTETKRSTKPKWAPGRLEEKQQKLSQIDNTR